ncbi:hypothetical protein CQW23_24396 [Capsicum baccatum]|uniref:NB-ARC domain-containing protein n=1 Tax=Capsicum baccatum TaxID=33114 RepID=A0A2G2VUP9_CAPBA|nr:hypothetical protein CQW23_24396 [Capsicum baccatum]
MMNYEVYSYRELSFPNSDIRDIDDERLACKLSAFSPPDEWELENNTKEDKETRMKKLLEILKIKKVLLIFLDRAGKMDELTLKVVSHRIRELKVNLVREILVTTALDAKGRVIKVEHKKNQITGQESLSSCCELIGKTINRTPGLLSKLLLENILMDFCCYENKFPFKRGSAYYSELITYWILEGFLGPFDCYKNAYEKGHRVIMALSHHCFIENQQAGYVKKNMEMLDLSASCCCCCRIDETVRLGLFLKKCTNLEIFPSLYSKKKLAELNLSGLKCKIEVDVDFLKNMVNLHLLDVYETEVTHLPSLSNLKKLKHLSLRGCQHLPNLEGVTTLEVLDLSV